MAENNLPAAEKRCQEFVGNKKINAFKTIAAYYFKDNQYKKAAEFYSKAGEHTRVIDCYYLGNMIPEAEKYCENQTGPTRQICAERLAKKFFRDSQYKKSIHYYTVSGHADKVTYIQTKMPIFELADDIEKAQDSVTNSNIKIKMRAFSKTLREYIYLDDYSSWTFGTDTQTDQRASLTCTKAFNLIESIAAPGFIDRVQTMLAKNQWTQENIAATTYPHACLDTLIQMISSIHKIARMRSFFSRYSLVYHEKQEQSRSIPGKNQPGDPYNYEEAYSRALDYADSIFATIKDAEDVTTLDWLKDYQDDLSVDLQNIDYILSMMDNLQIRAYNILRFSKQLKKSTANQDTKNKAEKLSWDFIATSNQVLHLIGKGKYQDANILLTTNYETIKKELAIKKE